jgi:hypothetical protein
MFGLGHADGLFIAHAKGSKEWREDGEFGCQGAKKHCELVIFHGLDAVLKIADTPEIGQGIEVLLQGLPRSLV